MEASNITLTLPHLIKAHVTLGSPGQQEQENKVIFNQQAAPLTPWVLKDLSFKPSEWWVSTEQVLLRTGDFPERQIWFRRHESHRSPLGNHLRWSE